ncbi:hypothetical protein E2562_019644 [Oryza meyeriana var. granulata]|uniref:CCHC-type domain-containing protein n=1 Tax=Oryza meyeriana var. granulata TaxID=110450 RepID=A0A6G1C7M1_9ORYZ|nr:hypothetical protein E2562_019644 [Oryza meyeriana var. granulata]
MRLVFFCSHSFLSICHINPDNLNHESRASTTTRSSLRPPGVRQPQSKPQYGSWREVVSRVQGRQRVDEGEEASWTEVRRGRRQSVHSMEANGPPTNRTRVLKTDREIPRWLQGRCFKCLGLGHRKVDCRGETRCFPCWFTGHIASSCKERGKEKAAGKNHQRAEAPRPLVAPRRKARLTANLPGPVEERQPEAAGQRELGKKTEMASGYQICAARPAQFMEEIRAGALDLRPRKGHCVLSWTVGMERNEEWLDHSLLATVLGRRPMVSPVEMVEAISRHTGIHQSRVRVEITFPEDFLISFSSARERNLVLRRSHEVYCNGVPISLKLWSRRRWGTSSVLSYFTKISLDGLPLHAWEHEAIRNLINNLGGQLVEMIPVDDARCLGLFAWFKNPTDLPQMINIEITEKLGAGGSWREGPSSVPPQPPWEMPTLKYRVILHVEEVIDPTLLNISETFSDDSAAPATRPTHLAYGGPNTRKSWDNSWWGNPWLMLEGWTRRQRRETRWRRQGHTR